LAIWAVVLAQAGLIAWLLYEQRRRRRSEAAAQALSGRLIHAHEEERSRLARELHDDVTQRLAVLAMQAGRDRNTAGAGGTAMSAMRDDLVRLSEDVHALSYRLHPSILADLGLREALTSECEHFSRTTSLGLELNADGIPAQLPHDIGLCLFRIAQESLRNIARHASATRAGIRLLPVDGGLQLTIRDNGVGFDPAQHRAKASLGLASMRQRVAVLGGRLKIDSRRLEGTTISAWVPIKQTSAGQTARAAS
jgi:signal transduction histidine kinase